MKGTSTVTSAGILNEHILTETPTDTLTVDLTGALNEHTLIGTLTGTLNVLVMIRMIMVGVMVVK